MSGRHIWGFFALLIVLFSPPAATASMLGGDGPGEYVILGDSYAAGDGLDPIGSGGYYDGTDDPSRNTCHRSSLAYGPRLAESLEGSAKIGAGHWLMPACSGDETVNLTTASGRDYSPNPVSQVSYLGGNTKFATLTIGGNDLGFADILAACVENLSPRQPTFQGGSNLKKCEEGIDLAEEMISDGTMQSRLIRLYRTIIQRAPSTRLTVTTYPRLFPDDSDYQGLWKAGAKYCPVQGDLTPFGRYGFASSVVTRFNEAEARMNSLITETVDLMRDKDGLPGRINLARLDTGELAQHPFWCAEDGKPESYIAGGLVADPARPYLRTGHRTLVSEASFHPTANGQAAFAGAIEPQLVDAEPLGTTVTNDGETIVDSGPIRVKAGAVDQSFTITAQNGTPDWAELQDPASPPLYDIGFEEVPDQGLEVTAITPVGGNSVEVRFNAPVAGTYTFRALVVDHNGDRASRKVEVTVESSEPPVPSGRFYFPGSTRPPSLSGNGRWIAYVGVIQINGIQHVNAWLRNTVTGEPPILASHNANGSITGGVEEYDPPGISDDGRWVTYASYSALSPQDTNSMRDVYLYDRETDRVTLVPGTTGFRAGPPSNDGRYVVVFDPVGALWRIDLQTGSRMRIDASAAGEPSNRTSILEGLSLSDDGQTVLFSSRGTNLSPDDTDPIPDLFLKNLNTGAVTAVTSGLTVGGERLMGIAGGTVDDSGRLVAFAAAGASDGQWRQMLLDRQTGETLVVASGSNRIQISADGTTVAYTRGHSMPPTGILGPTAYEAQHRGLVSVSPLSVSEVANLSLNYDGTEPRVYGDTPVAWTRGISDNGSAILWYSNYGYSIPGVYAGGGYFLQR